MSFYKFVKIVDKKVNMRKKGNNLLNELITKSNGIDFDMPYVTGYSDFDTFLLDKYIDDSEHLWGKNTKTIPKYMIGSTIGTHIGPGAVAVAFFEK